MDPILDTAPCGFLSFGDDGTIRAANQTLLDLLDRGHDDVVGRSIETLFTPGAKLFYHTHLFPLLRMQERVDEVYVSLRVGDDEDVKCLLNAKRTVRENQPVNDVVLMPFEERTQYEDEILQAKQAAEQANRAKEKFLSTMSHELRTPISTIKSLSQYLSMGVRGPVTDEQADYLERIEDAADYLDALISDILDFARLEAGSIETTLAPVQVEEALQRAESLVEVRFDEEELTYEREPFPSDLYVRADPDRLQQILLNLLTNAIKFTPKGGTVAVEVEKTADALHISVRDTGVGIADDKQPHIFDPFVQSDGSGGGVGLGLAISRDLATAMNGTLTVDSVENEGATFTLTLPLSSPPPAE
jgi:signal transduction histidine kinase